MQNQSTVQDNNLRTNKNGEPKIWKPFIKFIAKTKLPYFWIALNIAVSLFNAQLWLLLPDVTQQIISGDTSSSVILKATLIVFGRALLIAGVMYLGRVGTAKVSLSFRKFIWQRLLSIPVPFYDKNMPREMISRTTQDTTTMSEFLTFSISAAISNVYLLVGTFLILNSYNWRLAVAELVVVALIVAVNIFYGKVRFKYQDKVQGNIAGLTRTLSEILTNIPLVKTFVKEKKEEERGEECIDNLYKTNVKYRSISISFDFLKTVINVIQTIIIIVLGISLISKNIITIEIWIAFYLYATGLSGSVTSLMNIWTELKSIQGAARRITEIAVEPTEEYKGSKSLDNKHADIDFENVSFGYTEENVLNNISFKVPKGKTTAIVGLSGSGKSTIISLLERFYKPNSGQIKLDNIPINEYSLKDYRRSFGYVSQDTQLFSGTIRDNIAYGIDRNVSQDEIEKAAKAAYALDFINSFEKGFDTEIGEAGSKLSGGQRQRISIARAILKDLQYLLLDEATSSLDVESEHMVDKALKELTKGKTSIVIAHRLSTVVEADQIIVLDNKTISGIGTHEELLKSNNIYKKLMEVQLAENLS